LQTEVMQQIDISSEAETLKLLYGFDQPHCGKCARYCLVARKLVETGVRFVHVLTNGWNHHLNLPSALKKSCVLTDQPVEVLITDLKQRGLLERRW